ncbi:dynamin family protein [Thozetella sp. PMI_491]|nr:dynamin family protein [Thozetella sp. PMI_491]
MPPTPFWHGTGNLVELCSADRLSLMNSIDTLRSQGINRHVSLPQIIVCGDQSSGKSSVLEALSGVPFGINSVLCTRFPTEVILRRSPEVSADACIYRNELATGKSTASNYTFHERLDNSLEDFAALNKRATAAMGFAAMGKNFSSDRLRFEITGPDQPHLTIVDLPGLIHSQTKQQTQDDVDLIQDIVKTYMEESRSIILAVVSAKNDIANQVVLKLARSADPHGHRTLGVITKPDTLNPGSNSEATYLALARNLDIELRLGWHVLRNLDSEKDSGTLVHRRNIERQFFNGGVWKTMAESTMGIDELRQRLSEVLFSHITSELPSLLDEIEDKIANRRSRLQQLGEPRGGLDEQRYYLVKVSEKFQWLVKSAIDGTYYDPFFKDAETQVGYQQRFRAVVQNLSTKFSTSLVQRGHRRHIIDSQAQPTVDTVPGITREAYLDQIQVKMQRSRGRELPGLFDPMIVADLFRDQAAPWRVLVHKHIEEVWNAAKTFLRHVVGDISDKGTSNSLFEKVFEPEMERVLTRLVGKTEEILKLHETFHPITYDLSFTNTIQSIIKTRKFDDVTKIVKDICDVAGDHYVLPRPDITSLANAIVEAFYEPDRERAAASNALDYMQAYYEIAMKRFVDDVSIELVEANLVTVLAGILSAVSVFKMPPDLVTSIAGESEGERAERDQLTKQLEVLGTGATTCKRFSRHAFKHFGSRSDASSHG